MDNTSSLQNIVERFINQMESQKMIDVSDLPDIDLYMDQVTTFMDSHLEHCKRNSDDKILTKTMINNYAKNHLLPAPHKKKYSKDHMLLLIFIYYFKSILSINDIQKILDPMKEKYFQANTDMDMSWLYKHIMCQEPMQAKRIGEDIRKFMDESSQFFEDVPEEDRDYLHFLSLITLLSCDVYMKKQLIEKLIDSFLDSYDN